MASTYYDSELTSAEVDRALKAISDVVAATNNGKVLCITDGVIDAKSASTWGGGGGYPEPTGTIQITQNGTVDVKDYASAEVNVSGGGGDDWQSLKNYIESSGTQYIDTGYLPNDNTNVEIIASVSRGNNLYPTIFGMRPQAYSSAGSHDFLIHFYSNTDRGTLFEWNTGVAVLPFLNLVDKKTRYKFGANWYSVENDMYMLGNSTQPSGSINGIYPLYIFNFNNIGSVFGSDAACIMKLYRFRIFEGDTLIHEFIPWQENGVACLKDTITENLKYNAGTGDFVYGTDA